MLHSSLGTAARGVIYLVALAALTHTAPSSAQTVINIPPSSPVSSAGSGVIVNVLPGGALTSTFDALSGGTLNVNGGTTGIVLARAGGTVNLLSGSITDIQTFPNAALTTISGGRLSRQIYAEGSAVQMTGGRVGTLYLHMTDLHSTPRTTAVVSGGAVEDIGAKPGATIELVGLDFAVNGAPVSGLTNVGDTVQLNLADHAILTGTLADGRAFAHDQLPFASWTLITNGALTLRRVAAPAPPTPSDVHVTTTSPLEWIGAGQNVFVEPGGRLPAQFRAGPGSRVEVNGGYVEEAFHAVGAAVEINSGTVATRFNAYDGAVVDVNGGNLEFRSAFYHGSILNVHGGVVNNAELKRGAVANIHGGDLYNFYVQPGATANVYSGDALRVSGGGTLDVRGGNFLEVGVDGTNGGSMRASGGAFADYLRVRLGATLTLEGSDFRLNGAPLTGLVNPGDLRIVPLSLETATLTGVFADGTPFVFSPQDEEELPTSIQLVQSPYTPGPATIAVPALPAPQGVHAGQTLTVSSGGTLATNFTAGWGSTVNVQGGTVGDNFEAIGSAVTASGGNFGTIDVFQGAVVELSGTAKWSELTVYKTGVANVSGSSPSSSNLTEVHSGGTANFSGGTHGILRVLGGTVNITGGTFTDSHNESRVSNDGQLNVSGGSLTTMGFGDTARLTATGGTIGTAYLGSGNTATVDGATFGLLGSPAGAQLDVKTGNIDVLEVAGVTQLRGGALGDRQSWFGTMNVYGDDFQVDGAPIAGLVNPGDNVPFSYTAGTVFTGVLSDGTPFAIATGDNGATVSTGASVRLIRTPSPAAPGTIDVPAQAAPRGAAAGQTVIVRDGGMLGSNFVAAHGSTLDIRGGVIGANFEAERSQVTMSGGVIGPRMDVLRGAVMTVTGGAIGNEWAVMPGGRLDVLASGNLQNSGRIFGGLLNVSGGLVGSNLEARDGGIVNVSGGSVGSEFKVFAGSQANISGGVVSTSFRVESGGTAHVTGGRVRGLDPQGGSTVVVNGGVIEAISPRSGSTTSIHDGAFGDAFENFTGAATTLYGVDFEIDGAAVAGLNAPGDQATVTVASGQFLTGTFEGGTPMAFTSREGDQLRTIWLVRSAAPTAGPAVINLPGGAAPLGVRIGQTLNIAPGGTVPAHFNAGRGSTVTVSGGSVGDNLEAYHATVNVNAGQVGANMDAFAGSQIFVRGGSVGQNLDAYAQSTVSVLGGVVASVNALGGSMINVGGGKLTRLTASAASQTDWSGGVMEAVSVSGAGAALTVRGLSFELNGTPLAGLSTVGDMLPLNLPSGSLLTGILADGTPLVLNPSGQTGTQIVNGALKLVRAAEPGPLSPAFQIVNTASSPFALGRNQSLELRTGGTLASGFVAGPQSVVAMAGGALGSNFKAFGANVIIDGGTVGTGFTGLKGTEVEVFGGSIGSGFSLFSGAHAEIYGGSIQQTGFAFLSGSEIDVYGSSFKLNGQTIAGLESVGNAVVVGQRGSNQVLTGALSDGTALSLRLTLAIEGGQGQPGLGISNGAILRLHRLNEAPLPGDFDGDGNVDGDDLLKWQRGTATPSELAKWRMRFGEGGSGFAAVPEPAGATLALWGAAALAFCCRRSAS